MRVDAHHYAPEPGGKPALIIPHFEDGRLQDLVAVGLATRASRSRMGICSALGTNFIEKAREMETPLRLFADPIQWIKHRRHGACIIDWHLAHYILADLPAGIESEGGELLAAKVRKALDRPSRIPPIFVRETANAA